MKLGMDKLIIETVRNLSCEAQYEIATQIAANVGYKLVGETNDANCSTIIALLKLMSDADQAAIVKALVKYPRVLFAGNLTQEDFDKAMQDWKAAQYITYDVELPQYYDATCDELKSVTQEWIDSAQRVMFEQAFLIKEIAIQLMFETYPKQTYIEWNYDLSQAPRQTRMEIAIKGPNYNFTCMVYNAVGKNIYAWRLAAEPPPVK